MNKNANGENNGAGLRQAPQGLSFDPPVQLFGLLLVRSTGCQVFTPEQLGGILHRPVVPVHWLVRLEVVEQPVDALG